MNKNKGFIRLIVIILIALIIINFLGFTPINFWNEFLLPVISFVWGILVQIAMFLADLLRVAWVNLEKLIQMF